MENGTEYWKRSNEAIAKENKKDKMEKFVIALERDLRKFRELVSIHFNIEV